MRRSIEGSPRHGRYMWCTGLCWLIVATILLQTSCSNRDGRKTVEAEQFIVKDSQGKIRATLGILEGNDFHPDGVALTVFDPQGARRLDLGYSQGMGTLLIYKKDGTSPSLTLVGMDNGVAGLAVNEKVVDAPGGLLAVDEEGGCELSLWAPGFESRVRLWIEPDGSPHAELRDKEDKVVWREPASKESER